jgi:hypothetical protein
LFLFVVVELTWLFLAGTTGTPPYTPAVTSPADTSNFETVDGTNPVVSAPRGGVTFVGHQLPFLGFSFSGGCGAAALRL